MIPRLLFRRSLSSSSSSGATGTLSYPTESLKVPVGHPLSHPSSPGGLPFTVPQGAETQITTLANGLRVATQASFGQYSTVGAFIEAGSRYEVQYTSGISHFLSKLAFQSSSQYNSRDDIFKELEQYGGIPDFQMFRDICFYCIPVFTYAVPQAMSLLADIVWRPQLRSSELDECRQFVSFECEDQLMKPHPETYLMELVHQAAYYMNTLGLPCICPVENLTQIEVKDIKRYLSSHYIPSRMVVVGLNVDHNQMIDLAEKHFVDPVTSWAGLDTPTADESVAQYTGGERKITRDSAPIIGPNRLPELTHVAIAMESSSYYKDDFYAYAVLNSLMGGGGSFSAGGPGKGMYTQLYLNVLNLNHWIYHAQALNHAYSDSGLFCIFGSSHPSQTRNLVDVLCRQFYQMTQPANPSAVLRAKKQLQSTLLMNLESRLINFEDIGRQTMAHNKRVSASELCEKIEAVTSEDICRVAKDMFSRSLPSLAVLGDLTNVPQQNEIEAAIISNKGRLESKKSFFSFR